MSLPFPAAAIRRQVPLPLRFPDGFVAPSRVITFHGLVDGREHLALGLGAWAAPEAHRLRAAGVPLVRPHSECLTGDVFGSLRCDCGAQLREAVERVSAADGYLLYLRQEGRGIGLYTKVDAYELQDAGFDTYEANLALGHAEDERDYTVAAQMLHALGVRHIRLLTNNPDKVAQLERLGINIVGQDPTAVHLSTDNVRYLTAKARRGAHTIDAAAIRSSSPGNG
jgi:GTP cyclohydrolase II